MHKIKKSSIRLFIGQFVEERNNRSYLRIDLEAMVRIAFLGLQVGSVMGL